MGLVSVERSRGVIAKLQETKLSHLSPEIKAPRAGTKQAKLVGMLSRKNGVTLTKASEALGWKKHTTSATITGLKKRGYLVKREDRDGKDPIYRIICSSGDA